MSDAAAASDLTEQELRQEIGLYLEGSISAIALELWFVRRTWDSESWDWMELNSPALAKHVHAVDNLIYDFGNYYITEAEYRQRLRALLQREKESTK